MSDENFEICFCSRCGDRCRVDKSGRDPNAEMLRKSAAPEGVCLECAVTEWFANTYPLNMQLDRSPNGERALLIPPLQARFGDVMRAANANADLSEIDWEKVIRNWRLPLEVEKTATNPYVPSYATERVPTKKPRSKKAGK